MEMQLNDTRLTMRIIYCKHAPCEVHGNVIKWNFQFNSKFRHMGPGLYTGTKADIAGFNGIAYTVKSII